MSFTFQLVLSIALAVLVYIYFAIFLYREIDSDSLLSKMLCVVWPLSISFLILILPIWLTFVLIEKITKRKRKKTPTDTNIDDVSPTATLHLENPTLFYKDVPIVECLEKILATQDMNALRELIDDLRERG